MKGNNDYSKEKIKVITNTNCRWRNRVNSGTGTSHFNQQRYFEKLTVAYVVQKPPVFYETWNFIATFTKTHNPGSCKTFRNMLVL
jgi:hypothetical protein